MQLRAAIYARVSQDARGTGRSVTEQLAECEAICKQRGWQVVETFVDNDLSASRYATKERPSFLRLQEAVRRAEVDVLVTWEASRFTRDLEAYVQLRKLCSAGNVLWCYSGRVYDLNDPKDRQIATMDAMMAESASDDTSHRVKRSMRANANAGRPHGRFRDGYRRIYDERTGALTAEVIDEVRGPIIQELFHRVARQESRYSIARDFNDRGLLTPQGLAWNGDNIKSLLNKKSYMGVMVHGGQVLEGVTPIWPALVDAATYYAAQEAMSRPEHRISRNVFERKYLLSGIVTCGVCGNYCYPQKNRSCYSYICKGSFHVSRRYDLVDELVEGLVLARLALPDALEAFSGRDDDERARVQAELAPLKGRLAEFQAGAASGKLTVASLMKAEATLLPQIKRLNAQLVGLAAHPLLHDLAGHDVEARWAELELAQKQAVIEVLLRVEILPAGRGRRVFDPETVRVTWRESGQDGLPAPAEAVVLPVAAS